MAVVVISDSGKLSVTSSTATETKANNGLPLTLSAVEVAYQIGAELCVEPRFAYRESEHGKFKIAEVDKLAVSNPTWTITGVIDLDKEEDLIMFSKIVEMVKTAGYKTLSCDLAKYSIPETTTSVNIRIRNFQVKQPPTKFDANGNVLSNNVLDFTLECVETS